MEAIRSGEQQIEDTDEKEGRDKSLGASLDYGFRHAFKDDELSIIALLHLFQGTVYVDVLYAMGNVDDHALPELKGKNKEHLTDLLERAKDTGLLTQIGPAYFIIHPALPWFLRQLFARHYDGQGGRSTAQVALRALVEAVGELGEYYQRKFNEGNQGVIDLLELEEVNLLHARRLARRNQWWHEIISCMQGLRMLYTYQSRMAEWARLVSEIVPGYCTIDDEPIPGREDQYSLVMEYRIHLERCHERNLAKAQVLQQEVIKWDRQRAAATLALPADASLDDEQRYWLRTLAASLENMGQILQEGAGDAECIQQYQECIRILQCIGDKAGEATAEYNLGFAYKDLLVIRDLDAAEAAYQRSLDLFDPKDAFKRSGCIKQIGTVHHERFRDARNRKEPAETWLRHAQAAEEHYLQGLRLCPKDALTVLGPIHNSLGNLYLEIGQLDNARKHYELDAQYEEKAGNRFGAGQTRFSMALMYARASEKEGQLLQRRASLLRARAYAEAALRDYQCYQGRAAADEANAQRLLDKIDQVLAKLPQ